MERGGQTRESVPPAFPRDLLVSRPGRQPLFARLSLRADPDGRVSRGWDAGMCVGRRQKYDRRRRVGSTLRERASSELPRHDGITRIQVRLAGAPGRAAKRT